MEALQKEITEAIEKQLPAQVGDLLKKRLVKAEEDEVKVAQLHELLNTKREAISNLEAKLSKYQELDAYKKLLDDRENTISLKERNIKVFEAELKTVEAEKRVNEMFNLVGTVFRSPVFRSSYNKNDSCTQEYVNGQYVTRKTGEFGNSETREE